MSDHSSVRSAARLSLDSMIARDTRDCTLVRRSSFAEANYDRSLVKHGDVVDDLPVLMLWGDISGPKLVGYASNHYWTKRLPNDGTSR